MMMSYTPLLSLKHHGPGTDLVIFSQAEESANRILMKVVFSKLIQATARKMINFGSKD